MDAHLGKVQGTAVSRVGRKTEAKDGIREMVKMEEGQSRLERKKTGHKATAKLLLPMPIY